MEDNPNGWDQWGKHVLSQLKRLVERVDVIQADVTIVKAEIATLRVKSGLWGVAGAMIPVAIMLTIQLLV